MRLADVWMIVVFLSLTLYIVLDGYDLGIGVLTLIEPDAGRRREMQELVSWLWDGNESWLVLLALALWAGLPTVTSVALPALYIVLIPMLWSLIARNVGLELADQHDRYRRAWGLVFGFGSFLAAFCQGAAFGGVVAGLPAHGSTFAGGPFTFLHDGYAILTGLTAVVLYVVAGCAWLYLKTDGEVQRRAARIGRPAVVLLAIGTAASWLLAPAVGSLTLHPGAAARLPIWIVGASVLAAGLAFAFYSFQPGPHDARLELRPALAALAVYVGGVMLAAGLLYPTLVPPDVTVRSAASPHATLLFLTLAAAVIIPIILTYQAFGYWVFKGKIYPGTGGELYEGTTAS